MWHLAKISAKNICAFEDLEYDIAQNQATLIFGNNLDSDSQNSNGSGKSALIEVIAIGLTGEPLRKVNIDEIINDRFDEAAVSIVLQNQVKGFSLAINRRLSRKNPQEIQIVKQFGPYDEDVEEVRLATVADYNKHILDQIGLSKDDLLANFILTARKYKSFLSCSDKEKKEIINRFSNGIIVDESIEALQADLQPIQEDYSEAEKKVAECKGRVSAMASEIERTINESADLEQKRKVRIEGWKDAIAEKRQAIRKNKQAIKSMEDVLDAIDRVDAEMQDVESKYVKIGEAYSQLKNLLEKLDLKSFADYDQKINEKRQSLEEETAALTDITNRVDLASSRLEDLKSDLEREEIDNKKAFEDLEGEGKEVQRSINELMDIHRQLADKSKQLVQRKNELVKSIADLEKKLAGVIQCPKCKHEFSLADDLNVDEARKELESQQVLFEKAESDIDINARKSEECVEKGRKERQRQSELSSAIQKRMESRNALALKVGNAQCELQNLRTELKRAQASVDGINGEIQRMRDDMFDEAYALIDNEATRIENRISRLESDIESCKGSIAAYEQQIEEAENAKDDDMLARLKDSKAKYESDLQSAEIERAGIAAKVKELTDQEAAFIEFKTYLANTKIEAIAQITNNFLEAIGSDIRVSLSGYTMLKSGKIRDKISVSLIRDGIDCGSFDKFSAGEKCRVELASVLALHKLSNVNCEDGKGLNLLVIDEILDCTDEAGLANVFKALNDTQVTALVVSHGNIAENYAHRLVVTKQNGVSTLNGKQD